MVDLTDLTLWASLALVGATLGLVYATFMLKRATDHLARAQILPRLTLESEPYYQPPTSQHLSILVVNKGISTAFNTRVFAVVPPNNARLEVELNAGRRDILPLTEGPHPQNVSRFIIRGIVEGIEFTLELQYEDSEGYQYKNVIPTRTPPKTIPPSGAAN